MFVEEVPQTEGKTASGLAITSGGAFRHDGQEINKALFCHVIDKGGGFFDKDGKDLPSKCDIGDVVLLPRLSVMWFSQFGPIVSDSGARFGWTSESEVKGVWPKDSFDKAMKLLEEGLNQAASPEAREERSDS